MLVLLIMVLGMLKTPMSMILDTIEVDCGKKSRGAKENNEKPPSEEKRRKKNK